MKKISLILFLACVPAGAFAGYDTPLFGVSNDTETLQLNVRRVGLDLSKTQVDNAGEYLNSPVSALNATSQDYIKGVFDTILEFTKNKFKWDNSLFMEYGKTTLKPYNEPATTDENADKIQYSSDDSPRQNILRSSAGISLFAHEILKSLYLTGIHEYDFTYAGSQNSKFGAEIGWRVDYNIREGVKLSTDGYYREYLSYSRYISTDLERDLSAVVRLDTNLWGNFTMGPYVQYRLAKARGAKDYGSNLIFGISFNYITDFLL